MATRAPSRVITEEYKRYLEVHKRYVLRNKAYKVLDEYEVYRLVIHGFEGVEGLEWWCEQVSRRNKKAAEALMQLRNNSVPFPAQARAKVGT